MSLGARSQALYGLYRSRYGWKDSDYLEFCGHFVEGSLRRGTTRESLFQEFYAIERLDPGSDFRATTGELANQAGRSVEDFAPMILDLANTPEGRLSKDVIRFNTAKLGDEILFVWRFTVGHEYQRRYNEQLDWNGFEAASRELEQSEIDSRLRSIAARGSREGP